MARIKDKVYILTKTPSILYSSKGVSLCEIVPVQTLEETGLRLNQFVNDEKTDVMTVVNSKNRDDIEMISPKPLNYKGLGNRGDRIRTYDFLAPNQAL